MVKVFLLRAVLLTALILILTGALPALAQPTPTSTPNPQAQITFPPPVYTVRGQFPVIGTAALEGQANYFIEFRPIDGALAAGAGGVFFPAVLPSTAPVFNGLLGTWDTTLVPDGLYELRLTVNLTSGSPVTHVVTPLRVENNLDPAIAALLGPLAPAQPTPAVPPTAAVPPTPAPPTQDPTPRVTASGVNANVRQGDSTLYPIVGSLLNGQSAPITGISALGTGWYQIRLANGTVGWISPTVVSVSGDLSIVPRVMPPPLPPTPTPTPIPATPTPASGVNLVAGNIYIAPFPPTCGAPYSITFDVANFGNVPSPGALISFTDARAVDGQLPVSVNVVSPPINPGQ
ncbi:MAG: SH3 domain-containing protein, partial [Anaerolinea sp.]|nr:SH3 domain-containing protein [Anaerolinea sp.]